MAAIGNVLTIYLKSIDTADNEIKTNISKGFTINPSATFQQVDTASRALNALSTNTYSDTILTTDISVNEELQPTPPPEPEPEPEITITPSSIEGIIQFDSSEQDYVYSVTITVSENVTLRSVMILTLRGDSGIIIRGPVSFTANINQAMVKWKKRPNVTPQGTKTINGEIQLIVDNYTKFIPYTISYTP